MAELTDRSSALDRAVRDGAATLQRESEAVARLEGEVKAEREKREAEKEEAKMIIEKMEKCAGNEKK